MATAVKKGSETIGVHIAIRVAHETLENALMAGAISGPHGYAYWCSEVEPIQDEGARKRRLGADSLFRWLLRGGSLRVTEYDESGSEPDVHHLITLADMMRGFAQWVVEWGPKGERLDGGVMDFDIDAPASDAIMQFTVFGEQKYG